MSALHPGDRVRTLPQRAGGHTRLPQYLEQREGVVIRELGEYPLPDDRAEGMPEPRRSRLYTVRFAAPWHGSVMADLFDTYLEKAE